MGKIGTVLSLPYPYLSPFHKTLNLFTRERHKRLPDFSVTIKTRRVARILAHLKLGKHLFQCAFEIRVLIKISKCKTNMNIICTQKLVCGIHKFNLVYK